MEQKKEIKYDVIIIGGGPAGCSAGIYAARGCAKTAIIDNNFLGGQPSNYIEIENYPGVLSTSSMELMENMEKQVDKFGVNKYPMMEIKKVKLNGEIKEIETSEIEFKAKTIIIAAGARAKKLNIPGEEQYQCRGVSYCAVCDGGFYKDKVIAVIGGGDSALEEAIYLTKFAKKVYIIHRRKELRANKIIQDRAKRNNKIEFILNTIPIEIKGESVVEKLKVKNIETNKEYEIELQGVFPYIGVEPNTKLFAEEIKLTAEGYIETDERMETSIKGVYAAGDIRNTQLRQVITAAADGACAASSAIKYIEENEYKKVMTK